MTFDAWRSAVGGQWQRLLVYPGGVAALALVALGWLAWRVVVGRDQPRSVAITWRGSDVLALACPLVALALLPLAGGVELRSPLDVPTTWLLLDLPLVLVIAHGWRDAAQTQVVASRMLAGWLVGLPLLALLLLALGTTTGGITVANVAQLAAAKPLGWMTLIGWFVALLPALQLGPWSGTTRPVERLALALRRLGHLSLLVLALLPLWPKTDPKASGWWAAVQRDGRVPTLLVLAGLWLAVLVTHRLSRPHSSVILGRAVWLLGAGLLGYLAMKA